MPSPTVEATDGCDCWFMCSSAILWLGPEKMMQITCFAYQDPWRLLTSPVCETIDWQKCLMLNGAASRKIIRLAQSYDEAFASDMKAPSLGCAAGRSFCPAQAGQSGKSSRWNTEHSIENQDLTCKDLVLYL